MCYYYYSGHRGRDHMVAHVLLLLDYRRGRDHMVAHVLLLLDYSGIVV